MNREKALYARSESKCELCGAKAHLGLYDVQPNSDGGVDACVLICECCREQVDFPKKMEVNHWRCLSESMWNQVPAVQVMVWRVLTRLNSEGWAQDLLEMLYLDEETLAWAQAMDGEVGDEASVKHIDSNGVLLVAGDTVVLIKDLTVKGAGFTAKRGTSVRGISLVADNAEHIEGRVNGQRIVILTKFVKKSN